MKLKGRFVGTVKPVKGFKLSFQRRELCALLHALPFLFAHTYIHIIPVNVSQAAFIVLLFSVSLSLSLSVSPGPWSSCFVMDVRAITET